MAYANVKTSLGASLKAVATGGSLAVVAEMISITPPKLTRGVIDASDLSTTGGTEHIHDGLYDIGEFSGQAHWITGSTADDLFIAGITTGGKYDFKILVKAASGTEDLTFSGFFTEVGGDPLEISGKQTFSFTAKGTGDYAQAASA